MNGPPKPKFNRLYKIAGVVLILNCFVCLNSLSILEKDIERVVFSRDTVSVIERLFRTVKEADIGMRDFLLSGTDGDRSILHQRLFSVREGIQQSELPLG